MTKLESSIFDSSWLYPQENGGYTVRFKDFQDSYSVGEHEKLALRRANKIYFTQVMLVCVLLYPLMIYFLYSGAEHVLQLVDHIRVWDIKVADFVRSVTFFAGLCFGYIIWVCIRRHRYLAVNNVVGQPVYDVQDFSSMLIPSGCLREIMIVTVVVILHPVWDKIYHMLKFG